jgi:hypothetical protein
MIMADSNSELAKELMRICKIDQEKVYKFSIIVEAGEFIRVEVVKYIGDEMVLVKQNYALSIIDCKDNGVVSLG